MDGMQTGVHLHYGGINSGLAAEPKGLTSEGPLGCLSQACKQAIPSHSQLQLVRACLRSSVEMQPHLQGCECTPSKSHKPPAHGC